MVKPGSFDIRSALTDETIGSLEVKHGHSRVHQLGYYVHTKRRTTIEIDDDLLARARRALGNQTTRATVEEALRRLVQAADDEQADRAAQQLAYLRRLGAHVDVAVLVSGEMWR